MSFISFWKNGVHHKLQVVCMSAVDYWSHARKAETCSSSDCTKQFKITGTAALPLDWNSMHEGSKCKVHYQRTRYFQSHCFVPHSYCVNLKQIWRVCITYIHILLHSSLCWASFKRQPKLQCTHLLALNNRQNSISPHHLRQRSIMLSNNKCSETKQQWRQVWKQELRRWSQRKIYKIYIKLNQKR